MRSYALSEKSGGGTLKETTLWTNSAPTSPVQTISVPVSIAKYDYIKVVARKSTTDSTEISLLAPTDMLIRETANYPVALVAVRNNANVMCRRFYYQNGSFGGTWAQEILGGTTDYTMIIPIKIIGCKM